MPPNDNRKPPAGRTAEGIPDNNNVAVSQHHHLTVQRGRDLGLPSPPTLSPLGQQVVDADRGCQVVTVSPPAPVRESFTPLVAGVVLVDLAGATDCWTAVRDRFALISDVPDLAEVVVQLPANGRPISFNYAFAGWDRLPDITFTVLGRSTQQVRDAVTELRQAIANYPAVIAG